MIPRRAFAKSARTKKPWGAEFLWARTEHYVAKMLQLDPGAALSLQYHKRKSETICVLQGDVYVRINDEIIRCCQPYDVVDIPARCVHRFVAGNAGCLLIEVSTPELDDVVRLEDRYGRVCQNRNE